MLTCGDLSKKVDAEEAVEAFNSAIWVLLIQSSVRILHHDILS